MKIISITAITKKRNRINSITLPTPILVMSFIASKIFKASFKLPVFASLASAMLSQGGSSGSRYPDDRHHSVGYPFQRPTGQTWKTAFFSALLTKTRRLLSSGDWLLDTARSDGWPPAHTNPTEDPSSRPRRTADTSTEPCAPAAREWPRSGGT